MRSPKLGESAQPQYYKYYAGYAQGFVEDMITTLRISEGGVLLDPWNGAGTTTTVAAELGLSARGFDINPAAVMIGRARLLGPDVTDSLLSLAADICDRAARGRPAVLRSDDLLTTWFGAGTAANLRELEQAIHRVLVSAVDNERDKLYNPSVRHSSLAALFYVALFRTVRELVKKYVPSNPSWIKTPVGRRIGATRLELHALFVQSVRRSRPQVGQPRLPVSVLDPNVAVDLASSTCLPMDDESVAAIVASPPYLTRIDYVKATLPELAVLGLTATDIQKLRVRMIGTPLTTRSEGGPLPEWGNKICALINTIAKHPSKASATYYKRYYVQYFHQMWLSLGELHRVLASGRSAVLVVQDSYYKDVHVDLPSLIGDMSEAGGWSRYERFDFSVPRTMAAINPGARKYRTDFRAVESAVVLER